MDTIEKNEWVIIAKKRLNAWTDMICAYWELIEDCSGSFAKRMFGDMLLALEDERTRLGGFILDISNYSDKEVLEMFFPNKNICKNNIQQHLTNLAKKEYNKRKKEKQNVGQRNF